MSRCFTIKESTSKYTQLSKIVLISAPTKMYCSTSDLFLPFLITSWLIVSFLFIICQKALFLELNQVCLFYWLYNFPDFLFYSIQITSLMFTVLSTSDLHVKMIAERVNLLCSNTDIILSLTFTLQWFPLTASTREPTSQLWLKM